MIELTKPDWLIELTKPDWNWFFSSFAQSSAAIVGIIGAFIISKIISTENQLLTLNEEIELFKIKCQGLKREINNIDFSTILRRNDWKPGTIYAYIEHFKKLGYDKDLVFYKFSYNLCAYDTEHKISEKVDWIIETLKTPYNYNSPTGFNVGDKDKITRYIQVYSDEEQSNKFYYSAKECNEKASLLLTKGSILLKSKRILSLTIKILIFLFSVTVCYPLSFLPSSEVPQIKLRNVIPFLISLKGVLVVTLFIVMTGLFVYFLILISKMKVKNREDLLAIKEIKYFSPYFENREKFESKLMKIESLIKN